MTEDNLYKGKVYCPCCKGTGYVHNNYTYPDNVRVKTECPVCDGAGWVEV